MEAGPDTLEQAIRQAAPGTTIQLRPGRYPPLRISGIKVDPAQPIIVEGNNLATFDGGVTLDTFRPRAARIARETRRKGDYPGVYPIAREATLTVSECTGLTFRGLNFRNSWPTAIFIDASSDLVLDCIDTVGSSYYIYAIDAATRNLKITNCHWLQDPRLWRDVYWADVHEKSDPDDPRNYTGDRAYDGTFFCGFGIAGDVEVAHCNIEHAFNGVHLFNPDDDPGISRNIHVHHCSFAHIKDNPIEAEKRALNWWIHDNQFFNAHKWFSMELKNAGWFYIFRNRGWFTEKPGPADEDANGGAVFKFHREAKDVGEYPGPIHVFNNSWFLRSPIAKEGFVRNLSHHNNAIAYCDPATYKPAGVCDRPGVFGVIDDPKKRFTNDWTGFGISFINDCVAHPQWPRDLVNAGYRIDRGFNKDPDFLWENAKRFKLREKSQTCRGKGVVVPVLLPDKTEWKPDKAFNIGWHQDEKDDPPDPNYYFGPRYQRIG